MKKNNNLYTNEFEHFDSDAPLIEYPYPQFKRESYFSLNGVWNYKISKNPNSLDNIDKQIIVPFPIESQASKVNINLKKDEVIIYKKFFSLPDEFIKQNTFVHFLGVDQEFTLIINKCVVNHFIPLGLPLKIDISKYISEENEIILIVKDNINSKYPVGKQSKKPKGIFYTPFSGIYYPVFIESVNNNYISDIKITTTCSKLILDIASNSNFFEIIIKEKEKIIFEGKIHDKHFELELKNPIVWNIENPFLYELEIKTKTDKVSSYFGLREIELINNKFFLNKKEIFITGVLDQGYYPDGLVTPVSYKTLENDITSIKDLGFNTLRKHIKIEIPYFYYLCDKHGILVLQDFLNFGNYSFIRHTALPTIGFQNIKDHKMNPNKIQRENFISCGEQLVKYLHNHPSIIGYTIFNEGWGQFNSDNVYSHFKKQFPSVIFDATSGWFTQSKSDLISKHWYFKNLSKLKTVQKPVFLSEFGALCFKEKEHYYSKKKVFGYTYFNTKNDLNNAFINLFEKHIIPFKNNLNGFVYTQLSDIEEEDNGLFTYDRKILKIDKNVIKKILSEFKK